VQLAGLQILNAWNITYKIKVTKTKLPMAVNLDLLDPELLFSYSSSFSIILMRLSGIRSTPTTSQIIW
jgi:hypothetical protein